LAELIGELTGYDGEIAWDTTKPDGQPRRSLDTTRAKEYFDFQAATPFKDGLKRTIKWWRERDFRRQTVGGRTGPCDRRLDGRHC
jgi:nucleoside-diphosphate-sugar epimerase